MEMEEEEEREEKRADPPLEDRKQPCLESFFLPIGNKT